MPGKRRGKRGRVTPRGQKATSKAKSSTVEPINDEPTPGPTMPCKRPRCCKCKRTQKPSQTRPQIGDINLGKLADRGWEKCAEFGERGRGRRQFNGVVNVTATQPGEIAVADCFNDRVVICSNEGQHKATIPVNRPWAVAAIHNPEQRLLVLEMLSKYVKVFNVKDNKLAFQFPTVPPSQAEETQVGLQSLAVRKNGTVVVGDVQNNVLTEHTCDPTGKILRTIPVQTSPGYLAVDDDNDRIVVSGGDKEKADVLDGKGSPLSTIQPTINGQPAKCKGVYCNSMGIYLAVRQGYNLGNGHIHLYGLDGRFVDCLAQGLDSLFGITFLSNGQLVVTDFVSIKMYSKM